MRVPFRRILVVVKHTPYEQYVQLKAQGKAPLALRWERLKNRFMIHRECVNSLQAILERHNVKCLVVGREELDRQHIQDVDLVVAVGGDGTVLSSSHFLDDSVPLVGINSDPTRESERDAKKKADERRSFGALCYCTAENMEIMLPRVLLKAVEPKKRARIQTIVRSTFTETKLPPALNDILVAHPSPAAVSSRFRLGFLDGAGLEEIEHFSFNVWSSGIWICTATGSTAAMQAAGGEVMPPSSQELQYMVREHLLEEGTETHLRRQGHGIVKAGSKMRIRWNSQVRCGAACI
ncbi:unnamed protein product [Phaeothamnion confervicola]